MTHNGDLLPKSQDFESQSSARTHQGTQCSEEREGEIDHGITVVTPAVVSCFDVWNSMISRADRVLATHSRSWVRVVPGQALRPRFDFDDRQPQQRAFDSTCRKLFHFRTKTPGLNAHRLPRRGNLSDGEGYSVAKRI